MPHLITPYAWISQTPHGPQVMVNNAYWSQAIANIFKTSVLAGLEDAEDDSTGCRTYFNAGSCSTSRHNPPMSKYPTSQDMKSAYWFL